ncbi:MAG: ATP phosphoribosyltransferase [Planctomycetes bacterium]|nr:ATP phosphoribosyltransferase [Planctomycetota bacterium]
MNLSTPPPQVRLALPKGRMNASILQLLADAGMPAQQTGRDYRPRLRNCPFDVKLLKPQNVVTMIDGGSRDLGFAGADWVGELGADVVELLDLQLDPVRIVAAAPEALLTDGALPRRRLRVATEYAGLASAWIEREGLDASIVRSHGATEAFPPDDADLIVDNTATGTTLQQNGLRIVAELSRSSTRLFANPASYEDQDRRPAIDAFVLLLRSVLAARERAMLDVNVTADQLQAVIDALPAMLQPTVSSLHGGGGFAVRAAVRREQLPALLPELRSRGARDLVVTPVTQLIP